MRVAIIGGGAAGMMTAYLLDGAHDVTVFERDTRLGGHVRTLGKNTDRGRLPADLCVDNGVIEIEPTSAVTFLRLLEALGVPTDTIAGSTALYLADGRFFLSRQAIREEGQLWHRVVRFAEWRSVARSLTRWHEEVAPYLLDETWLRSHSTGDCLGEGPLRAWLRMLLMYAYSTPYAATEQFPAHIGLPVLAHMTKIKGWIRIVGGMYTYIEHILGRFGGTVRTDTEVEGVEREAKGVSLSVRGESSPLAFDAVVFAATPGQVLRLLSDPSESEQRRFGGWRPCREITTVVHDDFSMYEPYRTRARTEFDLFEVPGGMDAGYNAYLNRLAGLAPSAPPVAMSYNLTERIDPARVLQSETHTVIDYSVKGTASRGEVIEKNGENRTYFAGAWLGDGLHEGAAASAARVSRLLHGRAL